MTKGGDHARHNSNGSRSGYLGKNRFGLMDSEDMDGGLSTVFQFEQRFGLRGGSTEDGFDRLASAGLASMSWVASP